MTKKQENQEKTKKSQTLSNITALALVRNETGAWAIATLGIRNQKVETLDITKFDLLNYTLTRAHQMLQQRVIDLRKGKNGDLG